VRAQLPPLGPGNTPPALPPPAVDLPGKPLEPLSSPFEPPGKPAPSSPQIVVCDGVREWEDVDGKGAFLFSADYLLLKVRQRPMDYAIPGSNNPFGVQGDVASLSPDFRSGFRAGGGYRLPGEGWEASFFYTNFHSATGDRASAPGSGVLLPTLTHPGSVQRVQRAEADTSFNYNVFDLEVGRRFHVGEELCLRAFGGARFAHIGQGTNANYAGGDVTTDAVSNQVNLDGGGARVGGEASWYVLRNLGLYARGSASLLLVEGRSRLSEVANGTTTVVDVSDHFDKVIPVAELGVGVTFQYRNFRLSAGYEFTNWFGLIDVPDFSDDSHRGKLVRRTGDLSLDGLVLRAEFAY
jgi:hypothetical protein